MRTHPATLLQHGEWKAEIDVELVPLVLEIWRAGIGTIHSCQDVGENISGLVAGLAHLGSVARHEAGRASIGFASTDGLLAFLDAQANSGPRDGFYERLLHWASPGAWQCVIGLRDSGLEAAPVGEPTPSSRLAAVSFQVRFPRSDIEEATVRLQRHNRGDDVAPRRPSWATIEPHEQTAAAGTHSAAPDADETGDA